MSEEERQLTPMRLSIGGERFQIQTDLSEEELQELTEYVEAKMEVHLTPGHRRDPKKQLILMAMEIAAELQAAQRQLTELQQQSGRWGQRLVSLVELLSDSLDQQNATSTASQQQPLQSADAFLRT